jgi:lipopolysaccharide/colanic/teichoic acid biosynthesis glycosyltransferase
MARRRKNRHLDAHARSDARNATASWISFMPMSPFLSIDTIATAARRAATAAPNPPVSWPARERKIPQPLHSMTTKTAGQQSPIKRMPDTETEGRPRWKRAVDIMFSLAAMPVLAFSTLLTATVMALVSPGPVLFRQERIGYRGRRFMCYKFRTMHVGADSRIHQEHCEQLIQSNAPMVKMDARGDSRLIPGGRLIRASGLDELPQIINVLRGEMSLVGPRPCVPYEYEKYSPWQRARFNAMPGLTGLWQVSGKNRTTFDEMIRLDIRYSETRSWWMDLKIMAMTLPALLRQLRDTGSELKAPAQTAISERAGG